MSPIYIGAVLLGRKIGPDIRVTMAYTETVVSGGPDIRVTQVYTETVVKP